MSVAARPAQSCPTADARAVAAWLGSRLGQGAQLHADSRRIRPGDAFFAWPGAAADGRLHIDTARSKGASAIVAEAEAPAR
ncbi:MAG: Mur ligase domain-containing protein [Betaproteobacteria bacterium]